MPARAKRASQCAAIACIYQRFSRLDTTCNTRGWKRDAFLYQLLAILDNPEAAQFVLDVAIKRVFAISHAEPNNWRRIKRAIEVKMDKFGLNRQNSIVLMLLLGIWHENPRYSTFDGVVLALLPYFRRLDSLDVDQDLHLALISQGHSLYPGATHLGHIRPYATLRQLRLEKVCMDDEGVFQLLPVFTLPFLERFEIQARTEWTIFHHSNEVQGSILDRAQILLNRAERADPLQELIIGQVTIP